MTYNQFCKFMKLIKEAQAKEDAFSKAICEFGDNTMYIELFPMDGFIKALAEVVDDKGAWIEYYIYECQWGKSKRTVVFKNGGELQLNSYKKLWKIIKE